MDQEVCKKIVLLDENILQATILDKSEVIDSYLRPDWPFERHLPKKMKGLPAIFWRILQKEMKRDSALWSIRSSGVKKARYY